MLPPILVKQHRTQKQLLTFNDFNLNTLRKDIMGGVTAAIVSLPLALAFGVASGAGAEAGLYGAIIIGFFAAIFGGTPTLMSEPTGPMTVVFTAVVAGLIAANPEKGIAMAFTVVMLAGVFQIILGSIRLGRYITLMPYSVVSGFMSGIGVLLILMQLPNFFGQANSYGSVVNILFNIPDIVLKTVYVEVLLGIAALLFLFLTPKKITRYLPAQLLALIICTVLSLWFFSNADIRRIGEITLGWPSIHIPTFTTSEIQFMLVNGLVLGALGCIDSLLTAVISDSLTRHEHNSDKELVGQGIANLFSGLFGGLPGAGATMGTVVNIQSGARSAYSGVIRALTLLIILVGASNLVQHIPMAVLAAIAIKVGLNILDWSFVKKAHRISPTAASVMYGVMFLTIFFDLIVAVGVGMFIANLLTIDRLSELQSKNIHLISDADDRLPMSDEEKQLFEKANQKSHTLLVFLSGPMIFGVSKALRREALAIDQAEALVFDLSAVPFMDATISLAIENVILEASNKNKNIYIIHSTTKPSFEIHLRAFLESIPNANIVSSRIEAFQRIESSKTYRSRESTELEFLQRKTMIHQDS